MTDVSNSNFSQSQAINWNGRALMILAGAGAGKTHVLAQRIARLIEESPKENFGILGFATTDKNLIELNDRVFRLIPNGKNRIRIETFHSFAERMLRQHGSHISLKNKLEVLTQQSDQQALLSEAIELAYPNDSRLRSEKLLPLFNRLSGLNFETKDYTSFLKEIDGSKTKLLNDVYSQFTEWNFDKFQLIEHLSNHSHPNPELLADVYLNYRKLMREKSLIDVPSLMSEGITFLRRIKVAKESYNKTYRYVCVDDFQNISTSQYKFLELMVNPQFNNLFLAVDDDQIFRNWNGANEKRLWRLQEDFGMHVCQLPENHQCNSGVIKVANRLISHNFSEYKNLNKTMGEECNDTGGSIGFRQFKQFSNEIQWIAKDISKHDIEVRRKCAVFAGTKHVLKDVANALNEHGIDSCIANNGYAFESTPMNWFHSILLLSVSRTSQEYLGRICKSFYLLSGVDLNVEEIVSHARVEEEDYLRSWAIAALNDVNLTEKGRKLISESLLPHLAERLNFRHFQKEAFDWLDELHGYDSMHQKSVDEYRVEKSDWEQFISGTEQKLGNLSDVTLHQVLREFDSKFNGPPQPADFTPCLSIKDSNGKKFDHVYIIGLMEGLCPSYSAIERSDNYLELHEARRYCFAAITRAQKSVSLTCSSEFKGQKMIPSRFLDEMDLLNPYTNFQTEPEHSAGREVFART